MSYLKAAAALVVATIGALVTALGPGDTSLGDLDTKTWLVAAGAVLGSAALVYVVENIPGVAGGVAKAIQAGLSGGVASLVVALDDSHVTQSELLVAVSAAVVASGLVYQATNKPQA